MEQRVWKEWSLSRMMLGTVQFGVPYGVANRTGQPAYAQVREMVRAAFDGGVNCFDTAAAYGTSEEVLGRALHDLGIASRVMVVTKVPALAPEVAANAGNARKVIEDSIAESRRRLGMDCLDLVLFHRSEDAIHLPILLDLQAKGLMRHVGVSCNHDPKAANAWAETPSVSALQVPANLLDRRHMQGGVLRAAGARGVAVFIRSVYLQGLVVMPEESVPPALHEVIPVRRRLEDIAKASGITLIELALRYMLAQEGVTCVLTGVETVAQIRENIALFARGPLSADVVEAVNDAVPELPEIIVTPFMWPNAWKSQPKSVQKA